MLSQRKKGQGNNPCPSQVNKNTSVETPDKQSALTIHPVRQEDIDSITITIPNETSIIKEEKSTKYRKGLPFINDISESRGGTTTLNDCSSGTEL